MNPETDSYVDMKAIGTVQKETDIYMQVDTDSRRSSATISPPSTTLPPLPPPKLPTAQKSPVKHSSSHHHASTKFFSLRKQHSSGNVLDRGSSPSPLLNKTTPPLPVHLKPECELSLHELLAKHSKLLPMRVKVCRKTQQPSGGVGSGGEGAAPPSTTGGKDDQLSVGLVYNLHFALHRKVAAFADPQSGTTFSLPLDSAVKCALVYNPEKDLGKALTGYTFRDVADLAVAHPLPSIVCVTQFAATRRIESAFMPGEVLALKNVHRRERQGEGGEGEGKVCIGAYSMKTETAKVLEEGCEGFFCTQPSDVQVPLRSVVADVCPPYPCEVQLFETEREAGIPANVACGGGTVLQLLRVGEFSVIVATSPQAPDKVLEVAASPNTEVKVMEIGGKELLEMKSETDSLQLKYGVVKRNKSISGSAISASSDPFSMAKPSSVLLSPEAGPQTNAAAEEASAARFLYEVPYKTDDAHAQNTPAGRNISTSNDYYANATTSRKTKHSPSSANFSSSDPDPESRDLTQDAAARVWAKCEELQYNLSLCNDSLSEQRRDIDALQKELTLLKCQSSPREADNAEVIRQENIKQLKALSNKEVIKLLEALGLTQYKKKFTNERVTGRILAQCNDKILEKELGVSGKLNRMQLTEFIEGHESVHTVLPQV